MKRKTLIFVGLVIIIAVFIGLRGGLAQTYTEIINAFRADEKLGALKPGNLTIFNLRGAAGSWDENRFIIYGCNPPTHDNLFAVLPAGIPPYKWVADYPELVEIQTAPKGFTALFKPKAEGDVTITVTDRTGLKGILKLRLWMKCPYGVPNPLPEIWDFSLELGPGEREEQFDLLRIFGQAGVYYIDRNTNAKHPIWDRGIINSRKELEWKNIRTVDEATLNKYQTGAPLKLGDGALVTLERPSPVSTYGTIYLVESGKLRPIKSMKVFGLRGYKFDDVVETSQAVLDLHKIGLPIE